MSFDPRSQELRDFYCLNCGGRNIPVFRPKGRLRERGHRKALYCPHCHETVNHIECRNDTEAYEFKIAFENGEYVEEAKESIEFIKQEGRLV